MVSVPLFIVYCLTEFLSLSVSNTVIPDLPWASTDHQLSYAREALKVLVTCQSLFVDQLRNSSVGLTLYYAFLALACSIKAMQQVHYYNLPVQRVWLNSSRMTASLAIILFVRVILQLDISETVFYAPVMAYSSFKFF